MLNDVYIQKPKEVNMPIFQRKEKTLQLIKPKKFTNEKELQDLIEQNLEEIFNCSFVATEYSTGPVHGGRIDTLALSEENSPIIIEYKVVESSQLVTQSLYYLSWMKDHKGDFEIAVQKAFPKEKTEVDWTDVRVICIAPDYKKYDLHAVKMMGSNIELWQYKYYDNDVLLLEEIFRKSTVQISGSDEIDTQKNPVMVQAGKKAAITRATGVYTKEEHNRKIEEKKKELLIEIEDYISSIDESIEEVPKRKYIAYKVTQNFVCLQVQKLRIVLYLKVNPSDIEIPKNGRDMTNLGHYGTGDLEIEIKTAADFEIAKVYIQQAFDNIGGN